LLVGLVSAQRLALRQEEIAREAVPDLDGVAHLAEARNAFEKNDFHCLVLSEPQAAESKSERQGASGGVAGVAVLPMAVRVRRRDSTRERTAPEAERPARLGRA